MSSTSVRDNATTPALETSVSLPPAASENLISLAKAISAEYPKALAGGAVLTLALGAFAWRRARSRRPTQDEGSGVLGVVVKSALFAALKTVAVIELKRAGRKLSDNHAEPVVARATAAGAV